MSEESTNDLVTCPHCGAMVPPGTFCGNCGAHLFESGRGAATRSSAFAAFPSEHVLQPSVVSTLFPHIAHERSAPFRFGLLATAIILVLLGALRLTGPAIAAAALCVPILYLLYLQEVEVYEEEPAIVLTATVVVGAVLGALWAYLTSQYVTNTLLLNAAPPYASTGRVLVAAVLIPLGATLLMLVGSVVLYVTREFDEALDGFTYGVAGALGFTLATTVVELSPQITAGLTSTAPALNQAMTIIERGLLLPFIYATTTGLVSGAIWLHRGKTRSIPRYTWATTLPTTIGLAVIVEVALGFVAIYVTRQLTQFLIYAAFALFLLFAARVGIHSMLLSEAVEVPIGPPYPCPHCHHIVPRMAFCPHCGVATRATAKRAEGRLGRQVR